VPEIGLLSLEGGGALNLLSLPLCATVKALAQWGESPHQVYVNRPVAESNCGGEIRPWEATESELPVRNKEAQDEPKSELDSVGCNG